MFPFDQSILGLRLRLSVVALVPALVCLTPVAKAGGQVATEVSSPDGGAAVLGSLAGERLGLALRREGVTVVFIDVTSCDGRPVASNQNSWCGTFEAAMRTELTRLRVRYLAEKEANEVRSKIAGEQYYQHQSGQVPTEKAVELGRQLAFQAFVRVQVSGHEGAVAAEMQSVSIRDAAVTINETVSVTVRLEESYRFGEVAKGMGLVLLGGAMTVGGVKNSLYYKDEAEQAYGDYKLANRPDDAIEARNRVNKYDRNSQYFGYLALGGLAVVTWGVVKIVSGKESVWTVTSGGDGLAAAFTWSMQ